MPTPAILTATADEPLFAILEARGMQRRDWERLQREKTREEFTRQVVLPIAGVDEATVIGTFNADARMSPEARAKFDRIGGAEALWRLTYERTPPEKLFAWLQSVFGAPGSRPLTFRQFIDRVLPSYIWHRHCVVLSSVLQDVADDKRKRVLVFEPPRHGKTLQVSKLFPAYYLYRHPERKVGLCAYGAEMAYEFSREARSFYQDAVGLPKGVTTAQRQWDTGKGGGAWAAGIGGPATGRGFSLGILDDPIKEAREADSELIRQRHIEWYQSVFYTRLQSAPGKGLDRVPAEGAIVVVQTRWNRLDLSGWLLAQEELEDGFEERWHIVNLPAIAEELAPTFPASCTVEADWRQPGEALCEAIYPLPKLRKVERRVGARFFLALYQQRPSDIDGEIFRRVWWRFWHRPGQDLPPVTMLQGDGTLVSIAPVPLPETFHQVVQSWDMTFKDTEGSDYVCGQVWGAQRADRYLLDQTLKRLDFPGTVREVQRVSAKWPRALAKYVEDKANGPAVIATLRHDLPGMIAVDPEGGKVARAHAVSPQVESRNIYLPHPHLEPWVLKFIETAAAFPRIKNDDEIDAMTQALLRLANSVSEDAGTWFPLRPGQTTVIPESGVVTAPAISGASWRTVSW